MGRTFLGELKACVRCGKERQVSPSALKRGKGKYCSRECAEFGKTKERECGICHTKFTIHVNRDKDNRGKYCSMPCYRKSRKGGPTWNKGLPAPWSIGNQHRKGLKNPSLSALNKSKIGKANAKWKGDKVGYYGLHLWVKRQLGKPDTCEFCGRSGLSGRQIHWANRTGQYLRDVNDWLRLCSKCHGQYDKGQGMRKRKV